MNCKAIYKMLITVEFLVGPLLKQHSKKHIVFTLKMSGIGRD